MILFYPCGLSCIVHALSLLWGSQSYTHQVYTASYTHQVYTARYIPTYFHSKAILTQKQSLYPIKIKGERELIGTKLDLLFNYPNVTVSSREILCYKFGKTEGPVATNGFRKLWLQREHSTTIAL